MIYNDSRNRQPCGTMVYAALGQDTQLASLLKTVHANAGLSEQIHRLLPIALRHAITNIHYSHARVVIFVQSGAAASRVNLLKTKLLDELYRREWKIDDIRVRVQPDERTKDQINEKKTAISPLTVARVLSTSKETKHERLATALRKLSRTLDSRRQIDKGA